ncbi:hypothetical protein B0S90_0347 [Caldicellulosiruptor bescii]|jgi:hypothetical protein|uniref:Uncharacterized protein n=2 Tax=Caldicellulosiruptor bescii TaxID=31899 RepID=B9MLN1_CALBD|nr:hypothetical protein [Caldicellulosiruptor bescii]ACM59239.1 conserved hypothetical protein [Caldicellulosiruptor bescii DSM 6725]PBC88303.1 hypothetical protein B0S87_1278 [Caldicellulosiruptor bescii]PBC92216.1 hypothetical protein B0S89_2715 [Caldicellulosiruptor bescii]PBD04974.1 hypothetical protein B0S85_2692 [Caldicellulosiruptor bescii]PBD05395.1 hypothetical protein B0S90_0347 [Caldicellulosiruptor bescii]
MENRNVAFEIFLWLLIYLCFFAGTNLFSNDGMLLLVWSLICLITIFLITIILRFYITSTLLLLPGFVISCILAVLFMFNAHFQNFMILLLQVFSIHLMGFVEFARESSNMVILQRPLYIYIHVGLNLVLFLIHLFVIYLISELPRQQRPKTLDLTYTRRRRR